MSSNKKTAIIVGILFLIALVFNILGMAIYEPILDAPDYLDKTFPNKILVIIGLLIDFICIPAIILIPIVAYPILKQHNERLALGYVVFRAFEGILFAIAVIKSLSLISLSQEYIRAGAKNIACFQAIGNSIHAEQQWATLIYIIIFTLGASMFYYVLYKSELLPRFIPIWGLFSAAFLFTGALIGMFDLFPLAKVMTIFSPPFILNELTLAIWLIVKGFNSSVIASVNVKTNNYL